MVTSVDTCLFYRPKKMSFIAVYVDDIITFDVDNISVQELISNLDKRIRIEDHVSEKLIILSQE